MPASVRESTVDVPAVSAARPATPTRRTRLLALPEVRWAGAATVAFLLALPLHLAGLSAWWWAPLYAVAYAAGGWEPALEGLRALRGRTLDVDLLMIVAALGAAAIGQVMDGALLVVIFATSGALEALATARTEDSVRGLLDLAPEAATRITGKTEGMEEAEEAEETEETVPADRLRVGDEILVRPGERIGADGEVVDGAGEVDQATITGESLPVAKGPGDEVFAGTVNGPAGALRVRVARDPSDTVLARIVTLVEEASRTKAPTQLFIEKVEQRYAVAVVVATLAVFGIPLAFGADLTGALLRAMTFMIVASPCAVVLATMPPLLSAIANAGRHGVLVKSAVAMERLGEIDTVAYDKTGTLTEGAPRVVAVTPGPGFDERELLTLAAAVEHRSEHPIGRSVTEAARARDLRLPEAYDFTSTPGRGVSATVAGRKVEVGAPARLLPDEAVPDADGTTTVLVLVDGAPAGRLALADRPRPDAAAAVDHLARLAGTPPLLLTGDGPGAAAGVASAVGIADVRAGLLPHEKAEAVRELARRGRTVLVVGDGVNDAPALAAAHTGVAMGRAGSDLALETADAVVVRDELAAVPRAVRLSRRARRLVTQNLVIAGVCIAILTVWDLVGHLPLPLGVAGHEGSTVLVALNGLRLLREKAW
ncbi:heavy metal translocating P-type ATPase [Streptomyces sp. B-S-A8]|uniref:Heavy metal translocating P-type ATPase n=1 Tax=Streptomyces solicavernae TaxID=3043614 RepID=A0ABT6RZG7_9ACTN|nr:heavy metal translocating P-type ATPase [Streptomyces sp. B-S-A8]MDI3389840.1 heavy metal translocating P-type ATPase [Streptomyces sp. B-S-A8]